jgi:peptidoglycan/xylan/chitin deacetylase (PgdA/CDA1 family)
MNKTSLANYFGQSIGRFFVTSNLNRALTYHEIDKIGKFSVKLSDFKDQMQYLTDSGYSFNTISDMDKVQKNGKDIFITFDDGDISSLKAFELLISKGLKATLFLIAMDYSNVMPPKNRIPVKHIIDLHNNFIEIGCHSYSHSVLSSAINMHRETFEAKQIIESLVSDIIRSFSIPYGKRNSFHTSVLESVKKAGFDFCCTQIPSPIVPAQEMFIVPRMGIWNSDTIDSLKLKLNGNYDFLKLFKGSDHVITK